MLFVIIGLGNPGEKYRRSRHNIGFQVIDILAKRHGITLMPWNKNSLSGCGTIDNKAVRLLKPLTFMNLSGQAVLPLVSETGVSLDHIVVAHDDMDLEFGRIQIRKGGGDGGHRGVRSLTQYLNSVDFVRLRLGVGRPPQEELTVDYVLSEFGPAEEQSAQTLAVRAADAIDTWIELGLTAAMNSFNRWKSPKSTQEEV